VRNSLLAAAGFLAVPWAAVCQTAILQIRVLEGDGAVHAAGSRTARPLIVEVTDETGKPIERAAVSFHLPEEGAGGVFLNGLRTDVALTDAAGRASVRGLQWNRVPGRLEVRIFASFEQARAGTVSFQYIEGPAVPVGTAPSAAREARHGHSKWLIVGALAAGGAAAGILVGHSGGSSAAPAASPEPSITIGTPSIRVGKP
jgi:hypothetical protein